SYRWFMENQVRGVMMVLALAGAVVVGNDFRLGGLAFYLTKPLSRWHYVAGKCLAVALFINLMTTLPALVLFVQYGMLNTYDYLWDNWRLALGIVAYGLLLTVFLSLFLVAVASLLRRTVPLLMAWTTVFVFLRQLAWAMVRVGNLDVHWRL